MATPDTRSSIVIVKQITYRGATRQYTNRYHFEGDTPADHTAWQTMSDHIVDAEKEIFGTATTIVQAIGYDKATATGTNPHGDAVFSAVYSTVGTHVPDPDNVAIAGDSAALVRYSTPARSTKNHPVYLFNYYHRGWRDPGNPDLLASDWVTALNTYGTAWLTGFTDGTGPKQRCGPRGAAATGVTVDQFVRHRDFPN